jgi:hypothetical protein
MPLETTDKKGNYLFQRFRPLAAFEVIQNMLCGYVFMQWETVKRTGDKLNI